MLLSIILLASPAGAVLKEKNLARTLGVLRAELEQNYQQQQMFMQRWQQQGVQQHQQLVSYMTQCEQIGLMLYSQSQDNTFDMAYACQQATTLYRQLNDKGGNSLPYDKIIIRLKHEIERLDNLIKALKSMPPVVDEDVVTQSDSILLSAIDSLGEAVDSLRQDTTARVVAKKRPMLPPMEKPETESDEPLFLTGEQIEDRKACLECAETLRENMQKFLESMEAESVYYASVQDKVEQLNRFAQSRYKMLQDNIFKNGSDNYFTVLANLPKYIMQAALSYQTKYKPFAGKGMMYSDWRGAPVVFISLFLIIYLAGALLLTYAILRWCLPRRWRGKDFKVKRRMLNNVVGIAVFAVAVMVVRFFASRSLIQMGTEMIINMAWLLEAIFLSLYIRLKGMQMVHAAKIYSPLIILGFVVILFRIVLLPNTMINLIFPPILLGLTIWQAWTSNNHRSFLPMLDMGYSFCTTAIMIISTICAWAGYSLMAVQVVLWWTFQLAAIMTITCLYDVMKVVEEKWYVYRLSPELKAKKAAGEDTQREVHQILKRLAAGEYINKTWFYDLINHCLVPILSVYSVLWSIYQAASVFEMTDLCYKIFLDNFVDVEGLIQISIFKLCVVIGLYFIFRYLSYAVHHFYVYYRKRTLKKGQQMNLTLARNVISILIWGLYVIICLIVLKIPKDGISLVSAGLATGVGFAMQSILENFFYGISLMTGRLRVGDYIECDGIAGKVESITYQSVQITTADGSVISFLNSALFSKNFKNLTKVNRYELIKVPIGVAYGSNINDVRTMLVGALQSIRQDKNEKGQFVVDPATDISVAFSNFGDNSVDLLVCVWMLVENKAALQGKVKEIIYDTLNANNIEIPFPQRDVHIIKN